MPPNQLQSEAFFHSNSSPHSPTHHNAPFPLAHLPPPRGARRPPQPKAPPSHLRTLVYICVPKLFLLASSRSTPPTSRSRDASAAGSNSEESRWCPGSCLSLSGSTSSNLDDCGLGLDSTCSCDDIDSDSELCTHTKSKRRAVRPTRSTAVLRHVDSMLLRRPSLKVRAVDEDDTSDMPPPPLPPRLAPEGTSSWSSSSGGSGDMETAQDPTLRFRLATLRLNPVAVDDIDMMSPIVPLPSPALRFRLPGEVDEVFFPVLPRSVDRVVGEVRGGKEEVNDNTVTPRIPSPVSTGSVVVSAALSVGAGTRAESADDRTAVLA
ncbi:hypothetical protein EVG20_g5865 [Dentipellis fragilis]|uniref:Uncharacterized protein n=1 Tax=Dentipellis fragilis TaxID=205917 RepID=A0A4Y9YQ26_9AGAM|nr:hypothetical protein EVG20_g5865 [Dentipellis fragilis]